MNEFICFVAGKSGGHLLPCLTMAKKICGQDSQKKILFFTNQSTLDKDIIKNNAFITVHKMLPLTSLSKPSILAYFLFCISMIYSFCISFYFLIKIKPKKIISTGGSVSLPVCFAGSLLKIPIELIELNAIPGKALTTLAPLATTVSLCFQDAQKYFKQKCYLTSYPLRFTPQARIEKTEAQAYLGLNPNKKTIFIVGGSQGSLYLNNLIRSWIEQPIHKNDLQIIHQIGTNDPRDWAEFYKLQGISAFTFSFYDTIEYCYSAADLVICRAGAGTLFEVKFFNKPCITIPLETKTTNHQLDNARAFKKIQKDALTIVSQNDSLLKTFDILDKTVSKLTHHKDYL